MTNHDSWQQIEIGATIIRYPEPWVTREEICRYLRNYSNTLNRWISVRGTPVHRVGRTLRFKFSEIDEWVRAGKRTGAVVSVGAND